MPVTEIAQLPLLGADEPTPAFLAAFREALRIQDAWYARHGAAAAPAATEESSAGGAATAAEARGAALYARVDGPRDVLITAHWDTVAEHGAWLASADNAAALAPLGAALDLQAGGDGADPHRGLVHVAGVAAFAAGEPGGALDAPLVGLLRFAVRRERTAAFAEAWERLRARGYDGFVAPFVHRGGWRVEPLGGDAAACDEFVVIGGWASAEALAAGREICMQALQDRVQTCAAHLYKRLL